MISLRIVLALFVCFIHVPRVSSAFLKRSMLPKRLGAMGGSETRTNDLHEMFGYKLFFKGESLSRKTRGRRNGNLVLECEAGGVPVPTTHWLKDGIRVEQGVSNYHRDEAGYEEKDNTMMKLGATKSRLFLDCLSEEDAATYTCVAETPYMRKFQSTRVKVVNSLSSMYLKSDSCSNEDVKSEPARIYMWSTSRLEYEDSKVQLFCRAEGTPKPVITWYDRNKELIENNGNYRVTKSGDLIIRDISWSQNMGMYTCVAENGIGSDSTQTFLYPTARSDGFGFPL